MRSTCNSSWTVTYEAELQRFAELAAAAGSATSLPEFLLPLVPRRLRADRFDLTIHAGVAVTRDEEFSVRLLPLNAQFLKRTSAALSRYSRLSFSVHQIPTTKDEPTWPINMQAT